MKKKIRRLKLGKLIHEAERKGILYGDSTHNRFLMYATTPCHEHIYTGIDTAFILFWWRHKVFKQMKKNKKRGYSSDMNLTYLIACFNNVGGRLGPIDIRKKHVV